MPHCLPLRAAPALLAAFILSACGARTEPAAPETIRPVATFTVGAAGALAGGNSYSADIRPRVEARMAFRVGGKIAERLVELGTAVQPGQPLMRLDLADLQLAANASAAQVAAAKANDELAQAELKRTQSLAEQGFVSAGRVDQALSQAKASRANVDAVQASANVQANAAQYAVLRADAAGIVTAIEGEVGQVVAAGTPMLRIAQGNAKDVVFSLPEHMTTQARALRGKTVAVQLWAQPDATYTATVRDVSALADPATRTFLVKASLQDPQNTAAMGATASVSLPTAAAKSSASAAALLVPMTAVIEFQGKAGVWVVEGGSVKRRSITLGAAQGEQVLVTQGLAAGAIVVTAGVHTLSEGQKVKLLGAAPAAAPVSPAVPALPAIAPSVAPSAKP